MEVQGGRCQSLRPGASVEHRLRAGAEAGQGCAVRGEVRVSPCAPAGCCRWPMGLSKMASCP